MLTRFPISLLTLAACLLGSVPAQAGPLRDRLAAAPHPVRSWVAAHRPGLLVPKLLATPVPSLVVPDVMPARATSPACPGGVCPIPSKAPPPKILLPAFDPGKLSVSRPYCSGCDCGCGAGGPCVCDLPGR